MELIRITTEILVLGVFLMIMALALAGWGRFVFRLLGVNVPVITDTSSVWIGFFAALGLVEVVHFFIQIDWMVTTAFAVTGFAYLLTSSQPADRAACKAAFIQLRSKSLYVALAVIFIAIAIARTMEVPGSYDSGLYHFGSIKWLNEAPLIPGLANVHMRFGFNQSYFGFLALSNLAPYWNKGYAAGGLFLLLLTALTVLQLGLKQSQSWRVAFFSCLFVYLSTVLGVLANPSPDTAIDLLEICIFVYLFALLNGDSCKDQVAQYSIVISTLCIAAITIKLSSMVFAGSCGLIVLVRIVRLGNLPRMTWIRGSLLVTLFGLIHVLRSVLLSGVPFFPNGSLAQFSLPWAVTEGVPKYESLMIYSWARAPGSLDPLSVLKDWDWFIPWVHRIAIPVRITFGLVIASTILNIYLSWKSTRESTAARANWLYLPIWLSFAFWFLTAPDLRFLGPLMALHLALGSWQLLQKHFARQKNVKRQTLLNPSALTIIIFAVACAIMLKIGAINSIKYSGWQVLPSTETTIKRTDYGFQIQMPEANQACWDSDLVCTPYFDGNLHKVPFNLSILGVQLLDRYYFSVIPK